MSAFERTRDLEPIDAGQVQVQQHDTGQAIRDEFESFLTRCGPDHFVAPVLQNLLNKRKVGCVVLNVDDEARAGHRDNIVQPLPLARQALPLQYTSADVTDSSRAAPWLGWTLLVAAMLCLWPGSATAAPPGATAVQPADPPSLTASSLTPPPVEGADEGVDRVLRLEDVRIEGREQVSARDIRRVLRRDGLVTGAEIVWPADPRVSAARDRLRATGYFRRVTLRLEPVEGSTNLVVLVVDLEERPTVSVEKLYLGNSRLTPFRGGASIAERNFAGRGVLLGGAFVWSTLPNVDRGRRQQAYKVFAEAPRLGQARLGVLGSAYLISANEPFRVAGDEADPDPRLFRAFDYTRIGGLVGLTFPLLPELALGFDYRFERVDALVPTEANYLRPDGELVPIDFSLRDGTHRLTAAHFGVSWDGRDEAFLAGKGGRFGFDLQVSSPALGSQYEYIKLVAAGAYTIRLPWRHWLSPKVQGGQIAGGAPIFEQFYAGDLSAWTPGREQGLRFSTRNPIDVFGTGVDARTFGVLFGRVDLEYVWPLFRRTRNRAVYGGDLFLSSGIFTLVEDRAQRAMRRAVGDTVAPIGFNADVGLRLDTAIGTVGVSVGNVLRRTPL